MHIWKKLFGGSEAKVEEGRIAPKSIRKIVVICDEGDETLTFDKTEFVMRVFASQNHRMLQSLHKQRCWDRVQFGYGPLPKGDRTNPDKLVEMLGEEFDQDCSAYIQFMSLDLLGARAPQNITLVTVFDTPPNAPKRSYLVPIEKAIEPVA
jgi:hypothetical protein